MAVRNETRVIQVAYLECDGDAAQDCPYGAAGDDVTAYGDDTDDHELALWAQENGWLYDPARGAAQCPECRAQDIEQALVAVKEQEE